MLEHKPPLINFKFGVHDTRGVLSIHGIPGIIGSLASAIFLTVYPADAFPVATGRDNGSSACYQLFGLVVTIAIAAVTAVITSVVIEVTMQGVIVQNANEAGNLLLPLMINTIAPGVTSDSSLTFNDCADFAIESLSDIFGIEHLRPCVEEDEKYFTFPIPVIVHGIANRPIVPLLTQVTPKSEKVVVYYVLDTGAPITSLSVNTMNRLSPRHDLSQIVIQGVKLSCRSSRECSDAMKDVNLLGIQFLLKAGLSLIECIHPFMDYGDPTRVYYLTDRGHLADACALSKEKNPNPHYKQRKTVHTVNRSTSASKFSFSEPFATKSLQLLVRKGFAPIRSPEESSTTESTAYTSASVLDVQELIAKMIAEHEGLQESVDDSERLNLIMTNAVSWLKNEPFHTADDVENNIGLKQKEITFLIEQFRREANDFKESSKHVSSAYESLSEKEKDYKRATRDANVEEASRLLEEIRDLKEGKCSLVELTTLLCSQRKRVEHLQQQVKDKMSLTKLLHQKQATATKRTQRDDADSSAKRSRRELINRSEPLFDDDPLPEDAKLDIFSF